MVIPNYRLDLKDVIRVSFGEKVKISQTGLKKVASSQKQLKNILKEGFSVYGVNTGFGALAEVKITERKQEKLQENLLLSHSLGTGDVFAKEVVRGAIFLRANCLAKGFSGCRPELIRFLVSVLNRDIIPVVNKKGSVGASGDLLPLAQIGLITLGKGEVFYSGKRVKASLALKKASLSPLRLTAKEGLSLINGSEMSAAYFAHILFYAQKLFEIANLAASLSFFALRGDPLTLDLRIHLLKPYPGQIKTARSLRKILGRLTHNSLRIQDPYSIRCCPQVHGAAYEGLRFGEQILKTEINSVTDNPIILDKRVLTGGNFHCQALALAGDILALSLTTLSLISERRIFLLLDHKTSGLPPFLIRESGVNSGFMMAQVLAAALAAENKTLSFPASVSSLPTSANQEDFVSMSMNGLLKGETILLNLKIILAIELVLASQAIELLTDRPPKKIKEIITKIREFVPFLEKDQEISEDIKRLTAHLYELTR